MHSGWPQIPPGAALIRFVAITCVFACLALAAACAGPGKAGDKVLVTSGAYRILEKHGQAAAVFVEDMDRAPKAEVICERALFGKTIRTVCYSRAELEHRVRQHRETFQELTLHPGSGG